MSIIFEFFSGIGGFHQALSSLKNSESEIIIKKILPFDVNLNANAVYNFNFSTTPFTNTLECFKLDEYNQLCENNKDRLSNIIWMMSPPCQPFTSLGLQRDLNDDRTAGFRNLIQNILTNTKYNPDYIILENVKNFEYSNAWSMLIKTLNNRKYNFKQFILSPHQFGIPNRRIRYYLVARGPNIKPFNNCGYTGDEIVLSEDFFEDKIKETNGVLNRNLTLKNFLHIDHDAEKDLIMNRNFYLKSKHFCEDNRTYGNIVNLSSLNTNCFTKGYGKLLKGSGSVLYFDDNFQNDYPQTKIKGKVRFFTPEEIMKFMCFTPTFKFPNKFSEISQFKLVGNSINIRVVRILLKYLFHS